MSKKRAVVLLFVLIVLCLIPLLSHADTLVLPESLQKIKSESFFGDKKLDQVELPEGLLVIGEKAFAQSSVKEVYLPMSLESIAEDAFDQCKNVVFRGFPGTYGERWCEQNGFVYQLATTDPDYFNVEETENSEIRIIGYTGPDAYVSIPDKINGKTVIYVGGFGGNRSLKYIFVPEGVVEIGGGAFWGCSMLTRFDLPASLKSIGNDAYSCRKLLSTGQKTI